MAIIRNAANTIKKGRVGETTYYISKGQQIARQSRNDSNYGDTARRTINQQERRVLWANLVNFYKISSRWMPKAFESKRIGQTDYNKFMAINVPTARIPLTKSESEASACVIDTFLVSQGSLPSVEISQDTEGYFTNIGCGSLFVSSTTTVGQFSLALIENNANIRQGMQLSFVQYSQSVDPLGTPRAICRCYEVTLDTNSTAILQDNLPALATANHDGYIGTSNDSITGAFVYILSELVNGSLKVSTQQLIVNNETLIAQYTTPAQLEAAARSYGVDTEVVLNPNGTVAQSEEQIPVYIQYVGWTTDESVTYAKFPGQVFGNWGLIYNQVIRIHCSGLTGQTVEKVELYAETGTKITETEVTVQDQNVITTMTGITEGSTRKVVKFMVYLSDEQIISIEFQQ